MENFWSFWGFFVVIAPFLAILGGVIMVKARNGRKGSARKSSSGSVAITVAAPRKAKATPVTSLVEAMVSTNTGHWFRTTVLRKRNDRFQVLFPNGMSVWRRASQVRLIPAPVRR